MSAGAGTGLHVLYLTQVLPYPLNTGAKIRAYHLLQYLTQRSKVTLVSFVRDDDEQTAVAHLKKLCSAVHTVPMWRSRRSDAYALLRSLGSFDPTVIIRDRLPEMERLLRDLMRESCYHVIHADQTSMAQYGLLASWAAPADWRPRTVLDQHNAMHLLVRRQAQFERGIGRRLWQREARRFCEYERGLCRQFDHVLTVTEEDQQALLDLFEAGEREAVAQKFTVMPICVDPGLTEPVEPRDEGPHILHLGTMFWPPNVEGVLWFAREVLPLVLEQAPEAKFTVAGKRPPDAVRALAGPNVDVVGYVPDPKPLLARSRVFIVPVRAGGGMRVKILDGWQWGLPIVSTTIGAEGIRLQPGENILLADEPRTFADAVVRLLQDSELRKRMRESGRRWVEQEYDWRRVYRKVDAIYRDLVS